MKYKWVNMGATLGSFSSLSSGDVKVSDADTAYHHAVTDWDIDGDGKTMSSMLCVYLIRTASGDTYGGEAHLMEADLHYQIDSHGSRQEYVK